MLLIFIDMMNLIIYIFFVVYNLVQAKHDSIRIANNKRIYHGINGALYVMTILSWWIVAKDFGVWQAVAVCLMRIPVFNTSLNIFRGLPAHYMSSKTTSIIDKMTYNLVKKIGYYTYNLILLLISVPIYLI